MLAGILMGVTLTGAANLVLLKHIQLKHRREIVTTARKIFVQEKRRLNAKPVHSP